MNDDQSNSNQEQVRLEKASNSVTGDRFRSEKASNSLTGPRFRSSENASPAAQQQTTSIPQPQPQPPTSSTEGGSSNTPSTLPQTSSE